MIHHYYLRSVMVTPWEEDDVPDSIDHMGSQFWCKDGKIHRDGDLPAMILDNGKCYRFKHGIPEFANEYKKLQETL